MESYCAIKKIFDSLGPEQKLINITSELTKFKRIFESKPNDSLIRDKYLQLNCECGDFFLEASDYVHAKRYFDIANAIAPEDHYLKYAISAKLLQIEEELPGHGSTHSCICPS